MKAITICTIILMSLFVIPLQAQENQAKFYDFKLNSLSGEEVPMSSYKGKVVLVVNRLVNAV